MADEPVSALDVSIQAQVVNLLEDLQEELDLTYVMIAHDLSVVRHVSDRVAVMYLGKIVEIGDRDDLYDRPRHPYTARCSPPCPCPDTAPPTQRERIRLEGDVPSPINPPPACRFHTRCWKAQDICKTEEPPLLQIGRAPSPATRSPATSPRSPPRRWLRLRPAESPRDRWKPTASDPGASVHSTTTVRRTTTPGSPRWTTTSYDDEDRSDQVRGACSRPSGVLLVVGVADRLGTTIMVHALGLNQSDSAGPVGSASSTGRPQPLPTTALPVPGQTDSAEPTEPSDSASPSDGRRRRHPARDLAGQRQARWSGST